MAIQHSVVHHISFVICLHVDIYVHFIILALVDKTEVNKGVQVSLGIFMPLPRDKSQSFHSLTVTVLVNFLRNPHTTAHDDHFASHESV